MKLPCTTLPVVWASTMKTPELELPEMTFRSGPGPPIVLSAAPSLIWTPSALGIAAVIAALRPIVFPFTTLPEAPVRRRTPLVPLPETTLPGPIVLPSASDTMIPLRALPTAAVPPAFRPTKFAATVLPVEPLIRRMPLARLPDTTLPGPTVLSLTPLRFTP